MKNKFVIFKAQKQNIKAYRHMDKVKGVDKSRLEKKDGMQPIHLLVFKTKEHGLATNTATHTLDRTIDPSKRTRTKTRTK
jgi:hypothetical protein